MVLQSGRQAVRTNHVRLFHSCRVDLYKQKKKPLSDNPLNLFKRGTPKTSGGGSIQDFKFTAAHSKFAKYAPTIPPDAPGGQTIALNSLVPGVIGQYPVKVSKSLANLGSYRRNQRNELFKEHTTLIRESTSLPMFKVIEEGLKTPSRDNRYCILGDPGIGKSTLLAQTHAFALAQGYVVLPITLPYLLLSGGMDATYNHRTKVYSQAMYAKRWLRKVARSNASILKDIKVELDHSEISGKYQSHSSASLENLLNFTKAGISRRDVFDIADEMLMELANQSDVPVLFTMDDINVLATKPYSENRNTENEKIYHGDLQFIKHFLDFLSGERTFKKGAIITATSGDYGLNDTIPVGLKMREPDPYSKLSQYDPKLASKFSGVASFNIEKLSLAEVDTTLQYLQHSQVIRNSDLSSSVEEKYFMSGNGNPRELLRSCIEISS